LYASIVAPLSIRPVAPLTLAPFTSTATARIGGIEIAHRHVHHAGAISRRRRAHRQVTNRFPS
jgi:hypothetical protein